MNKYILWDNDGVLVETEYWYFRANQMALSEVGIDLDKSTYLGLMAQGRTCWELAQDAGIAAAIIDAKRAARNRYYQHYLVNENLEMAGVISVLKALSKTHKMAIVTTSRRVDFELIHKNRDILAFMEFALTREDYVQAKPDPEPYLLGLSMLGAQAKQCVVIEDSQRGLQSAVAAGIDCIIVHNDFTSSHDFSAANAVIGSIDELPNYLK